MHGLRVFFFCLHLGRTLQYTHPSPPLSFLSAGKKGTWYFLSRVFSQQSVPFCVCVCVFFFDLVCVCVFFLRTLDTLLPPPLLSRNIYYLVEVEGELVLGTIVSDSSVAIISFSEDINVRGEPTS